MAAENIGSIYNTKMPGYEDPADIQEALRLYHYGSSSYDPENEDTETLVNPSMAYHLNDLRTDINALLDSAISGSYTGTEPVSPTEGYVWVDATTSASTAPTYPTAIFTNSAPTVDLVHGLLWVDKDSSPLTMYVYDTSLVTPAWREIGA